MRKLDITEVKRASIKKEGKIIETNTYIMTFNHPKILEKIKIGYTMDMVQQSMVHTIHCNAEIVRNLAITGIIVEVDKYVGSRPS